MTLDYLADFFSNEVYENMMQTAKGAEEVEETYPCSCALI
jgi:hypothetical protein